MPQAVFGGGTSDARGEGEGPPAICAAAPLPRSVLRRYSAYPEAAIVACIVSHGEKRLGEELVFGADPDWRVNERGHCCDLCELPRAREAH